MEFEEFSTELKTLKDALAGVPEAIEEMKKKSQEEIDKIRAEYDARIEALGSKNAPPQSDDRDPALKEKEGDFSWTAMFKGACFASRKGSFADAARFSTKEGSKERRDADFTIAKVEEKAMSTTAGSGGYHVPEEWSTQAIEQLYAGMATTKAGVQVMPLSDHTVRMPVLSTSVTGYWIGEGSSITASDQADTQRTMSPHQASAFTIASNMLLNMSNPAAGNIIKNDMIQILGQLIDLAVLQGSGVSNQPQGIDNVSGINTVTAGGALTWALIEDFPYELDVDNAPSVKRAWIMHPRTLHNIRQLTTSNTPLFVGTPQAQPLTNDLAGGGLIGYPVYTTTQIPITGGTGSDASVYFCDWNDVVLANWGGLEIVASSESGSSFQQNQTHIRAIHLVDVMVRHPVSCCLCNDTTS